MELWRLYDKQKEALEFVEKYKFSLLIGQSRASKTCFAVWYLFLRAWKHPNTTHVMFRNTLSSGVDGLWNQTVKEVITHFYPILPGLEGFKINESSHTITFPNGSRILLRGLDTPERATKVLSQQFATVLLDETQTIDYCYLSLLLTRLPQPKDVDYKVKIICTANYAPKTHWTYSFFSKKENYETKTPHNLNAEYLKFVTEDNKSIDAEAYLNTIISAGDRRSRAAYAGQDWFDEVEGALWVQEDIKRSELPSELEEIVLAFDPAVSNNKNSDEHGLCIAGKLNDNIYIINCFEKKEDVNVIAKEACKIYHEYDCSKLVYENNQGGDFIEALIRNHDKRVYCESVRAKKGKLLRAESAAALYKNGLVYHTKHFQQLEDQMLTYIGTGDSPNALDALVYSIKYLSENSSYVDPNAI